MMYEEPNRQITPPTTPINILELTSGATVVYIPKAQLESFKKLVQRGMATWERAPISIMEFADYFIEGRLVQNYKDLTVYQRNNEYGNSNANGQQKQEGIDR